MQPNELLQLPSDLLPSVSLLEVPKYRKRNPTEQSRQFVAHIATFLADQTSDRSSIPRNLHAEGGSQEPKRKSADSTPSEWKQLAASPCVPVVVLPACPAEDDVLLYDDDEMDYRPVSDD